MKLNLARFLVAFGIAQKNNLFIDGFTPSSLIAFWENLTYINTRWTFESKNYTFKMFWSVGKKFRTNFEAPQLTNLIKLASNQPNQSNRFKKPTF